MNPVTLNSLFGYGYGDDDDEGLIDYQLKTMSRMHPQSGEMWGNTFDAPGLMLAARQFNRLRERDPLGTGRDPFERLGGLMTLRDLFGGGGLW